MTACTMPLPGDPDGFYERKREMRAEQELVPNWLLNLTWPLCGAEGEEGGDAGGAGTGEGGTEGGGTGDGATGEGETETGEETEGEEEDEELTGLKTALKKEREARKIAQKNLRNLQSEVENLKKAQKGAEGQAEDAETKKQADAAAAKLERLALGFQRNAVDTALTRALQDPKLPKFTDPDDVLRLVDREGIDTDQDDDDPSRVEVDEDDVRRAIKALAKRKPHLLVKKEEESESSSSGGGGGGGDRRTGRFSGGKNSGQTAEAARRAELERKYPALGRR